MVELCSECGADQSMPRGHIFIRDIVGYYRVESNRCPECGRVKDFDSMGVIYRNFKGSKEYFEGIRMVRNLALLGMERARKSRPPDISTIEKTEA